MAPNRTSEARAIDNMLCFALYAASRATTQAYRRILKPWGLTYPQYLVLMELWEGEPRTVGELGHDLALDSGTLSPLLSRLEKLGHVARTRSSDDARVVSIGLTEQGRGLRAELSHVPGEIGRCTGLTLDGARGMVAELHDYTDAVNASNSVLTR